MTKESAASPQEDREDAFERAVWTLLCAARDVRRHRPRTVHPTENRILGEVLDLVAETRERAAA